MKLKKSLLSTLLAVTVAGSIGFTAVIQSGCANLNNNTQNEQTETVYYKLTLNLNGGKLAEGQDITQFEANKRLILPTPTKSGYTFVGWYDNAELTGSAFVQIDKSQANSDKEFWAKWEEQGEETSDTYTVTLHLNGGSLKAGQEDLTSYKSGTAVTLPLPEREGYGFVGWYDNDNFEGAPVTEISETTTGNKNYYAKWDADSYTVTLHFNGGEIISGSDLSSYTYGVGATLPILNRSGYNFDGWYENSDLTGNRITEISKTDTGDKTYYAKWTAIKPDELNVTSVGGYDEGAYIELELMNNTTVSDYTVAYKSAANGVDAYQNIDAELVRESNGVVRADIVGLIAGTYTIRVTVNNKQIERTVQVSAYDRSGYAHFNGQNVGAYTDDGILKSNAKVIYVTEETKNSVEFKINNRTYVGIANILSKAGDLVDTPLVVRIIGTVGAATWNEIDYSAYLEKDSKGNLYLPSESVMGINGKRLPTDHKDITQQELIAGGYNTLNTSVYSELIGLSSKATWSNGEYDSAWNNCSIVSASNVTVEGIGTDARIFQWGFTWKNCNSIEVRNLTFEDYTEDACSFEGSVNSLTLAGFDSKNIWVHHNTFLEGKNYWDVCPEQDKREGDGATDFKKNSDITISYNHYIENHKTGLIGGGDEQTTANVTFHHNWYERCSSRLPLGREANMHMYNNFYDGSTGTNMSLRAGAYALIENCYFKNANNPITTQDGNNPDKTAKLRGVAKVVNCVFDGCAIGSTYINNNTVYNFSSNTANRATIVDNDNIFHKSFDTDPTVFYYSETENRSVVIRFDGKNSVPQVVEELSGVHKNK